jgi:NTE family protein
MKKIGLALSGGGARGFAHVGVLKVLDELGVKPTHVSGCSMGSIIGALYCIGFSAEQIERKIDEITIKKIVKLLLSRKPSSSKIEHFLNVLFEEKNFEDLLIPLYVNAVDINTGEEVIFNKGNLAKAVRASIAIPMIFKPAVINGRVLVDGGIKNNLPVDILIEQKIYRIIGSYVNNTDSGGTVIEEVGNDGKSRKSPSFAKILDKSIAIIQSNKNIINYYRKACDVFIDPNLEKYGMLDFSKKNKIMKIGNRVAKQHKKDIELVFKGPVKSNKIKDFFKNNLSMSSLKP